MVGATDALKSVSERGTVCRDSPPRPSLVLHRYLRLLSVLTVQY